MKEDKGITIIRLAVAILLGIHGITRVLNGGAAPFGEFLTLKGFPLGLALAWSLTIFEIAGAAALMLWRYVIPVAALFIAELTMGIILVHAREGWFVVGAGRNGVEYSVLLIISLVAVIVSTSRKGVN